mmetsp:Transcript_22413/g.63607  ORF Transcript_22413/g.63607 Transcript_22413/m.63607 type:complete len:296 (+) Transcript_22413:192-1079(+)
MAWMPSAISAARSLQHFAPRSPPPRARGALGAAPPPCLLGGARSQLSGAGRPAATETVWRWRRRRRAAPRARRSACGLEPAPPVTCAEASSRWHVRILLVPRAGSRQPSPPASAPRAPAAAQARRSSRRFCRSQARRRRRPAPFRRRRSGTGPVGLPGRRTATAPKPSTPRSGSDSARAAPGSSRRRMRWMRSSWWYCRPCSWRHCWRCLRSPYLFCTRHRTSARTTPPKASSITWDEVPAGSAASSAVITTELVWTRKLKDPRAAKSASVFLSSHLTRQMPLPLLPMNADLPSG